MWNVDGYWQHAADNGRFRVVHPVPGVYMASYGDWLERGRTAKGALRKWCWTRSRRGWAGDGRAAAPAGRPAIKELSKVETMMQDVMEWAFSDMSNAMWLVAAVAVVGALNGVRLSWTHARRRRRGT